MILKHPKLSLQQHFTSSFKCFIFCLISDVLFLQNAIVWMEEPALPITSSAELIVAYVQKDTLEFTVN